MGNVLVFDEEVWHINNAVVRYKAIELNSERSYAYCIVYGDLVGELNGMLNFVCRFRPYQNRNLNGLIVYITIKYKSEDDGKIIWYRNHVFIRQNSEIIINRENPYSSFLCEINIPAPKGKVEYISFYASAGMGANFNDSEGNTIKMLQIELINPTRVTIDDIIDKDGIIGSGKFAPRLLQASINQRLGEVDAIYEGGIRILYNFEEKNDGIIFNFSDGKKCEIKYID